jgi:hypothetical protein
MKKKAHVKQPQKPCIISYNKSLHGWVIKGRSKPIFNERQDLENYCRNILGRLPILDPLIKDPPGTTYPQLPKSSVWTGAPWDRYFAKYQ